jgi:hypothetical protein
LIITVPDTISKGGKCVDSLMLVRVNICNYTSSF